MVLAKLNRELSDTHRNSTKDHPLANYAVHRTLVILLSKSYCLGLSENLLESNINFYDIVSGTTHLKIFGVGSEKYHIEAKCNLKSLPVFLQKIFKKQQNPRRCIIQK